MVEWLENEDGCLECTMEVCDFWLQGGAPLAIPCEFQDKGLLEDLMADVVAHVARTRVLRANIASLLQDAASHSSIEVWRGIREQCSQSQMDLESLDERCDACGVPMIDPCP